MTLFEALNQSEKIRRSSWLESEYITTQFSGEFVDEDDIVIKLSKHDIFAEDWEVAE